ALTRDQLFVRLADLGIRTETVEHPPAFTVEDSGSMALTLPGAHTKNLFLKDDEGTLVLVIAKSSTRVDLKVIAKHLGSGRFSFGKPDLLMLALGGVPGSVTAFAAAHE